MLACYGHLALNSAPKAPGGGDLLVLGKRKGRLPLAYITGVITAKIRKTYSAITAGGNMR